MAATPNNEAYPDLAAENLVTSTRSTAQPVSPEREFHIWITGSGSCVLTPVYSKNGSTFLPKAAGVDGGAPIISGKVAYAGSPIVLSCQAPSGATLAAVLPETVTGTVTIEIQQG